MLDCPACGEPLHADEEWRLREGLALDEPAEGGDYVHKRCTGSQQKPDGDADE